MGASVWTSARTTGLFALTMAAAASGSWNDEIVVSVGCAAERDAGPDVRLRQGCSGRRGPGIAGGSPLSTVGQRGWGDRGLVVGGDSRCCWAECALWTVHRLWLWLPRRQGDALEHSAGCRWMDAVGEAGDVGDEVLVGFLLGHVASRLLEVCQAKTEPVAGRVELLFKKSSRSRGPRAIGRVQKKIVVSP